MEIQPETVTADMKPNDRIKVVVGIHHKCDMTVTPDGHVRIYYGEGEVLVI